LSSSPSNNEAFGYAGIAQRVGCTEATWSHLKWKTIKF
jgi:hypothetical protein